MNANRPFEVVGEDGNQIDTYHSDWVPFLPARVAERALEQTRMYLHRAVRHQPAKVVSHLAERLSGTHIGCPALFSFRLWGHRVGRNSIGDV